MTVHDPLRHLHRQGRPGHGRLRSVPAPDVAALLTELERSEPRHAGRARDAIDRLTGGEPLETLTELTVCEFLWYTLPTQVAGDREAVVSALGRLLALGGLDRYAALCSSPVTARVLRAYERSEKAGTAACRRALDATGLLPPDLPELRWSSIMGPEERGAHGACSAALELALVCGEPASDSAAGREALTRRWLTEPRADLGGDNWLHRVRGERLNRWVLGRGDAWRELAQPFEAHLHAPVPAPAGTFLPALRWLLELGRRPGGMVPPAQGPGPSRPAPGGSRWSEGELEAARELAEGRMGALRRVGRRLVTTREGRRLLGDRDLLWEAASAALLAPAPGEDAFRASAREAALMLLAEGAPADRDRVAEVVGRGEGRAREVDAVLADLARRLAAFGLRTGGRLTPAGRSAVLAALRSHALRPRSYAGAS